jgi:flagellar biosynthesis protein FliP
MSARAPWLHQTAAGASIASASRWARACGFRPLAAIILILLALATPAAAQSIFELPVAPPAAAPPFIRPNPAPILRPPNPIDILSSAAELLPGGAGAMSAANSGGTLPRSGRGEETRGLSTVLNIMLLLTVITLAPSIILMTTCFVRIIVVLALLRQAIGAQSLPPPQVTIGLAMFMTLLVMSPTIDRVYNEAVVPYQQGEIRDYETLWERGKQPIRDFMFDQIEATGNWSSLFMVLNYRGVDTSRPELLTRADVDMITLIPSFMLSELKTAFLMGFRIYLPFLVIDMVIATMLISMSMMMLPPVLISLPFKLLLFVLVDGWQLVVGSLMASFRQPDPTTYAFLSELSSVLSPGFG